MQHHNRRSALLLAASAVAFILGRPVGAQFTQTNLVSDGSVSAAHVDPNLLNPWGIAHGPLGSFIISNNHSATATGYYPDGSPFPSTSKPFMINIPGVGGGAPTGVVVNPTSGFVIRKCIPAWLLFAGEDGTIEGYNNVLDPLNVYTLVDKSWEGTVYKGIALASPRFAWTPDTPAKGELFLYATDFHNNKVDVFDSCFRCVGSFTDPTLPKGYAPFGIRNFCGLLYVTFALQLPPDNHDDQAGPGNGYVDIFAPNGCLIKRLISNGNLNSPWGLTMGPRDFGKFEDLLLVGNFGDGKINAYDPWCGKFYGTVTDTTGADLVIPGLWGLTDGGPWFRADHTGVYFTSGPNGESNGLFGVLHSAGGNH